MITNVFNKTAQALQNIAQKVNLTYNEVNIIVYYIIVPLSWFVMLDFILKCWPLLSALWALICISVIWWHRRDFSRRCDMVFDKSVAFLLWFRCIGWDYYKDSVIICVALPIIIYALLLTLLMT